MRTVRLSPSWGTGHVTDELTGSQKLRMALANTPQHILIAKETDDLSRHKSYHNR